MLRRPESSDGARRRRSDIASSQAFLAPQLRRQVYENGERADGVPLASDSAVTSDAAASEPTRVIWGTNISISESMVSFKTFLTGFKKKYRFMMDGDEADPLVGEQSTYLTMLEDMWNAGTYNMNLDAQNLLAFPPSRKLYHQLTAYPLEIIPIMDQSIKNCLMEMLLEREIDQVEMVKLEAATFRVKPFNLQETSNMRDLNPGDIDKMVAIKGLVTRITPVIPDMKQGL